MALLIGALIGLALGLTGAGGSLVAVPLFILLLNSSPQEATTLSLLGVFIGAFFGVLSSIVKVESRRGILWGPAILLLILGVLFAPLGRWLALYLTDQFLVFSFSALALVIAFFMWPRRSADQGHSVRAFESADNSNSQRLCPKTSGQLQWQPLCFFALVLGGAGVGFLSGVYGVGGGFLIVPLMLLLTQASMAVAVKTSLLVIAAVSAAGLISGLHLTPSLNFTLLFQIALGSTLGMSGANYLGRRLDTSWLQKFFSIIILCLSALTVTRYF